MRKQIIIFTMLFALNFLNAQDKANTIIGKWMATENGQTAGIEFLKSGKANLLTSGKVMQTCDYTVNYKKAPAAVSLIIDRKDGKKMTIYGLIKFINPNSIKWEIFPMAETQPKVFSEGSTGKSVVLKRVK